MADERDERTRTIEQSIASTLETAMRADPAFAAGMIGHDDDAIGAAAAASPSVSVMAFDEIRGSFFAVVHTSAGSEFDVPAKVRGSLDGDGIGNVLRVEATRSEYAPSEGVPGPGAHAADHVYSTTVMGGVALPGSLVHRETEVTAMGGILAQAVEVDTQRSSSGSLVAEEDRVAAKGPESSSSAWIDRIRASADIGGRD